MDWSWDLKTVTDLVTALAAIVGAIGSWLARGIAADIRSRITVQNVQTTQQTQAPSQNININVSTAGQGAAATSPTTFQQGQSGPSEPTD